mgnify:FL=1|jgi:hypothetical protein
MKLYVANSKKQNEHFHYRVIGSSKLMNQHISAGQQIQIYGDLQPEEVRSIIEQHEQYGFIDASKIKAQRDFVGLCYSVDTPVKLDYIKLAFDLNDKVLDERGQEIRKAAAIAADQYIDQLTPGAVNNTRSSVIEAVSQDKDPSISEGFEVSRGRKRK